MCTAVKFVPIAHQTLTTQHRVEPQIIVTQITLGKFTEPLYQRFIDSWSLGDVANRLATAMDDPASPALANTIMLLKSEVATTRPRPLRRRADQLHVS